MRRRSWFAGVATLALLALPRPAAAMTYVGMEDLTCGGVTVDGAGLPASTPLRIELVDPGSRHEIEQAAATTSATGAFSTRLAVSLSGRRSVRAVVRRPGSATPLAWTQQTIPTACPLAMTGPGRPLPLVGVGSSSVALGVLLLAAFAYRGRHAAAGGRHLAARGRHAAHF